MKRKNQPTNRPALTAARAAAAAATLAALGIPAAVVVPAARAQEGVLPAAPFAKPAAKAKARANDGMMRGMAAFDPTLVTTTKWVNFGPFSVTPNTQALMGNYFVSGRVNAVAYHPTRRDVYYAATAGGGLWRYDPTLAGTDGGAASQLAVASDPRAIYNRWRPLSDGTWPTLKTSCVAIARTDPRVIYVGTGDFDGVGAPNPVGSTVGNGIMRSTNEGRTWVNVGQQLGTVTAIQVHPDNPKFVLATSYNPGSRAAGANPSWGHIWLTTDGGEVWNRVTPNTPLDDFQPVTADAPKLQIGEGWSDIEIGVPVRNAQGGFDDVNGDGALPDRYVFATNRRGGLYRALLSGPTLQPFGRIVPTHEDPQDAPAGTYFSFRYNPVEPVADTTYPDGRPDLHPDRSDPNAGTYGLEVAASSADGRTVYVIDTNRRAQDGRLWRSTDGGATWIEITGNYVTAEGTANTWALSNYALHMTAMPVTGVGGTLSDALFGAAREMAYSLGDSLWTPFGTSLTQSEFHVDQHDMAFFRATDFSGRLLPQNEFLIANDGGVYVVSTFNALNGSSFIGTPALNRDLVAHQFYRAAFNPIDARGALGGTYANGVVRTAATANIEGDSTVRAWETIPEAPSSLLNQGTGQYRDDNTQASPLSESNPDNRATVFQRGGDGVSDLDEELFVPFWDATNRPNITVNGFPIQTGFVSFPDPRIADTDTNTPGWQPGASVNVQVYRGVEPSADLGNLNGGGVVYNPDNPNNQFATRFGTSAIYMTNDNWATSMEITPNRLIWGRDGFFGTEGPIEIGGATQFAYGRFNAPLPDIPNNWNGETKAPSPAMMVFNNRLYVGAQYLWRYDTVANSGQVQNKAQLTDPDLVPRPNVDRGFWRRVGNTRLATDEGAYITAIAQKDGRCYVGTSDGNLWMSNRDIPFTSTDAATPVRNLNTTWVSLNGNTLPSRVGSTRRAITSISVNPLQDDGSSNSDILVTIEGAGVYRCQNTLGGTFIFTDQNGTVPGRRLSDITRNVTGVVRDNATVDGDPINSFFVSTDRGVYFTNDLGSTWYDATGPLGLPYVACNSLSITEDRVGGTGSYLNVATFGRGLWRLKINPIEQVQQAPALSATSALARNGQTLYLTVTVRNDGGTAQNVRLTGATLAVPGRTTSATPLPFNFGAVGNGPSSIKTTVVNFPGTAGRRGEAATLTLTLTYEGGTPITQTLRLRLP